MRKVNRYSLPNWARNVRDVTSQFIIPITIFQGIRTLFFPSAIDLFCLLLLIALAWAFKTETI